MAERKVSVSPLPSQAHLAPPHHRCLSSTRSCSFNTLLTSFSRLCSSPYQLSVPAMAARGIDILAVLWPTQDATLVRPHPGESDPVAPIFRLAWLAFLHHRGRANSILRQPFGSPHSLHYGRKKAQCISALDRTKAQCILLRSATASLVFFFFFFFFCPSCSFLVPPTHLVSPSRVVAVSQPEKPYMCATCLFAFASEAALDVHEASCQAVNPPGTRESEMRNQVQLNHLMFCDSYSSAPTESKETINNLLTNQ